MSRSKFAYELIMKFWKFGHVFDNWPLLSGHSSEKNTSAHIVPVNQAVKPGENVVLPMQVLTPIIEGADAVAILNECMCRRGQSCNVFPASLGCLLLGPAARDINPGFARIVDIAEAVAHAEKAIRMGLVPLVVHNAFDAWIWGIEYDRMMNICFCCDCCCDVRIGIRKQLPGFYENIHRLPGLTVSVGDGCTSCGICRDVCMAKAIELKTTGAYIEENCKGCGRCVPACPEQVISMSFNPQTDTVRLVLQNYEQRSAVGPLTERPVPKAR